MKTSLGATYDKDGRCRFLVWAPRAERVEVRQLSPQERSEPLERLPQGYHRAVLNDFHPSDRYVYRLYQSQTGEPIDRPDPASRCQPEGVHGPSQIVETEFSWEDADWHGLPLSQYIIYELHVGTFTPAGTFDAVIMHLDELKDIGISAIELMPVAQFPGTRNWGYDGTYPFAAQNSYGGPQGLKRLVNACHRKGLAVILDVVYNHLGPEGNYLRDFGPYFTDFYNTPWGEAINFDGPHSDDVRRFFIENALYWVGECHIDALRIDAVHAILDFSARPFLEVLTRAVHRTADQLNRRIYCIAESALNDTRIIRPRELGGFALDAQWNDDFHHALHTLLTGEQAGYYRDFGRLHQLARAWRQGFVYEGQYSSYRQRAHGNSSRNIPAQQLVVFSQNHDQIGNRLLGERLSRLVSFEDLKLAAGLVLMSPFIPLIFMGEEYGETSSFQYFIDHSDPQLINAVREGRRREFAAFGWQEVPPDPQDEATFLRAKLDRTLRDTERSRVLLSFYRELIGLRKKIPALARLSKKHMRVVADDDHRMLFVRRRAGTDEAFLIFCFGNREMTAPLPLPAGGWKKILDSADLQWLGPGSLLPDDIESTDSLNLTIPPNAVVVYRRVGSLSIED
ncbi:MAG: malto-oligosyltrehalose trehalohydrolase [Desulfobacterales bacterium]|nr:MAG: malto-oligosyltrehalose trehalohydrolase [Desulfobacterales bacterium]